MKAWLFLFFNVNLKPNEAIDCSSCYGALWFFKNKRFMHRIQREYEKQNPTKGVSEQNIEKYLWILGIIIFLGLGLIHDINLSKHEKQTSYFLIINKDYKDISNDFIPRYSYVLKIKRFDFNKKEINTTHDEIKVSKLEFDNLKTDTLYNYTETFDIRRGKHSNEP